MTGSLTGAANAAPVTHLTTQTATATGAGAAGTPSIASFNIPSGKNRVLFIWTTFERDHCSNADVTANLCVSANTAGTGLGDNYPEPRVGTPPSTTSNNQLTARLVGPGGTIDKQNALVIGGTPSGDTRFINISVLPQGSPAGSAFFSLSSFHIVLSENEINTLLGGAASGTVSITLPDTSVPSNAGDDAMLIASVFQNVEQAPTGFVRNATATAQVATGTPGNSSLAPAAYDAGQAPDEADDGKLVMGANSSTEGFLTPAGHVALATLSVTNAGGNYDTPNGNVSNEPNGLTGGAYFRNGGATPSSLYTLQLGGAASTLIYGATNSSFLLESDNADVGDAPLSYGNPTHTIVNGIRLGASVDADASLLNSNNATGDNTNGTNDEDGVTIPTLTQGQSATISVNVNQVTAGTGRLQGWIDWNGDGDFADAGEQIATNLQLAAGTTGTISVPVTVPAGAITSTPTVARFRWSTTTNLNSTATATDGEVEDYQVTIAPSTPPSSFCSAAGGTLGSNLFSNNGSFGTGSSTPGTTGSALTAGRTTYTHVTYGGNAPNDGQYSIVNQLNEQTFSYWFNPVFGHTTGTVTDQMMVVNASFTPGIFYTETLTVPANQTMDFGFWVLNLPSSNSFGWTSYGGGTAGNPNASGTNIKPDISLVINRIGVDDNNNGTIDEAGEGQVISTTGAIPFTSSPTWMRYGALWHTGNSTQVEFRFVNNAPGGAGNDLALDDLINAPCTLPSGNITGTLYRDQNTNNTYNSGTDLTLPTNIAVDLKNSSGGIVATAYTDASGFYSFTNVPAGSNYTIQVALTDTDIPSGATATANPSGASTTGIQTGITVTNSATLANQNFGFTPLQDRSDAPISGTAPNGTGTNNYGEATHAIDNGIKLGAAIDSDAVSIANADASGDGADDDGIILPNLIAGATSYSIPAANILATGTGTLHAWIDFNKNGTFEVGEYQSVAVNSGIPAGALSWSGITIGPVGNTFARFRLTTDATVTSATPSGNASNGEVEDYQVVIGSRANVLLVKRITEINGDRTQNPNAPSNKLDQVLDRPSFTGDDAFPTNNWPSNFLKGAYDAGPIKPGDTVEYTVYFMNSSGADAANVKICDRIVGVQQFVPDAYGTGRDIEYQLGTNGVQYLTKESLALVDRAELNASTGTIVGCPDPTITGTNNGTVVIDITGSGSTGQQTLNTLPGGTGQGTPANSYGYFRFKTKVNP